MSKLSADLSHLLLRLLLLPLLLFWVPLMYAMAWVHEAFEDLRPPRLRPAPALLPLQSALPSRLPPRLRH
jgi:hypothetical protein